MRPIPFLRKKVQLPGNENFHFQFQKLACKKQSNDTEFPIAEQKFLISEGRLCVEQGSVFLIREFSYNRAEVSYIRGKVVCGARKRVSYKRIFL